MRYVLAMFVWLLTLPTAAAAPPRVAILVGSNQAIPGRLPLRYAYRDAEKMAEALATVGRFAPQNVHVLRDPTPEVLVAFITNRIAGMEGQPDSLLYFYYSGHADEGAIYPAGKPLPFERLRRIFDSAVVDVKIGMVDTCRGGSWTRAKGLTPEPPFDVKVDVAWPLRLDMEGSVLIASSSGLESAHESDLLQGSFFTSYFAAGLRGAADRSGNGDVTLTEAFEYAKERTIRDTLRHTRETQHPSYAMNLRGRNDLVLAQVAASPNTVEVEQKEGPLEFIHAETGVQLLELPTGKRRLRLAVPLGRYLIRKNGPQGFWVKEITVDDSGPKHVDEAELTLVANTRLAIKGEPNQAIEPVIRGTLPGRRQIAIEAAFGPTLAIGQQSFAPERVPGGTIERPAVSRLGMGPDPMFLLNARWALTDRLTWRIGTLGFAYRIEGAPGWELCPVGGLVGWESSLSARFIAGTGVRRWIHHRHAINAQAHLEVSVPTLDRDYYTARWRSTGSLGYSLYIGDRAVVNFAVGGQGSFNRDRFFGHDFRLWLGSGQELGLRQLPLVEMFLNDRWSVEVFLAAEYRFVDYGEIRNDPYSFEGTKRDRWIFPMALGFGYVW